VNKHRRILVEVLVNHSVFVRDMMLTCPLKSLPVETGVLS
jgi:hypothetical protein